MLRLVALVLPLAGLAGGVVAGLALRPAPEPTGEEDDSPRHIPAPPVEQQEFVRLGNQFVVPIVRSGRVESLVVLSLSVAIRPGGRALLFEREPLLRDALLRGMFAHATLGGFDGAFTAPEPMAELRAALTELGRAALPGLVFDVLITDIVRQDN